MDMPKPIKPVILSVVFWQPRHFDDGDPFFVQCLSLFRRCLTVNAFSLCLAIMDLAGFFGELVADIAALFLDFCLQRAHFGNQSGHLARRIW